MRNVYAVATVPVVGEDREVIGWARADIFADGTRPTDKVILRDGVAYDQVEATAMVAEDPLGLLWPTRDAAARDGLAALRAADGAGGD